MAIVKLAKHKNNYTKISNKILNDPAISLKAKGLWTFLMSKPDDWNITISGTSSQLKEGYDALKPVFKELERAGYLVRATVSHGKGKITTVSTLLEEPGLSTVRNDPIENDLSTVPFTADEYTAAENIGGIVKTDKLRNPPTPSGLKAHGQDASLLSNKERVPKLRSVFSDINDEQHHFELLANELPYFEKLIGYSLDYEEVEALRQLISEHGKPIMIGHIRELHDGIGKLDVGLITQMATDPSFRV